MGSGTPDSQEHNLLLVMEQHTMVDGQELWVHEHQLWVHEVTRQSGTRVAGSEI